MKSKGNAISHNTDKKTVNELPFCESAFSAKGDYNPKNQCAQYETDSQQAKRRYDFQHHLTDNVHSAPNGRGDKPAQETNKGFISHFLEAAILKNAIADLVHVHFPGSDEPHAFQIFAVKIAPAFRNKATDAMLKEER